MSFKTEHKKKFDELRFHLDITNRSKIKSKSNGGNSILFSYDPLEEKEYIDELKNIYSDKVTLIYINQLLVNFIDYIGGWDEFEDYFYNFKDTPHLVFKPDNGVDKGLFDLIIESIVEVSESGKIPVLVRTGSLDGTGIENSNIMENSKIMNLNVPLIIFYPSKLESDNLLFLNYRSASKYRCILI
jgi:hypothetical protein